MGFYTQRLKLEQSLSGGDIVGTVAETDLVEHRILVPPNMQGKLVNIAPQGNYTITEIIATIEANGAKTELNNAAEMACEKTSTSQSKASSICSVNHWATSN